MGCAICYWVLPLLSAAWTKAFTVQGPAVPLSVQLGASVTLPCSVDTPLPLSELEVQWMRAESGTLVHLFQEGQSRPESQNPSYSSRAEFFTEEIPKGNFSLLLINVTTEDMGVYRCAVHTDLESNETNVEIRVERLVVTGASEPVSATAERAGFFILTYISAGFGHCFPNCCSCTGCSSFCGIIREDDSKGSLKLCCLQVVVPCTMICVAFIMWGVIEGFIAEAYTCSAVSLMRILMLFKVAPYLGQFPEKFCNICKNWAVCEYGVVLTGVNSIVLWKFLTEHSLKHSQKSSVLS
ncbi:hypothetical protein AGOR_G00219620 [Albula goreensis]|uniref:Ig-like domain-containing protein n=1 Tax=Albula goreensis TaxID=1534307 RepID=A0A8T3CS86_9TELE|nr:hypothetical protein AGOR_G00219620 [Albula goreensis]